MGSMEIRLTRKQALLVIVACSAFDKMIAARQVEKEKEREEIKRWKERYPDL